MIRFSLLATAILLAITTTAQDLKTFRLYKPDENAEEKLAQTILQAKNEGKHVFVQIGGNWCIWCARFNQLATTNQTLDSIIKRNFIVYHLNYSKENKNSKLLEKYGYPQRFGFPVFLILNGTGQLLHTQNSVYLEEGKGYNEKTVAGFLTDWSPGALDPKSYKDQ
jgi:thioredoxin-related protein